MSDIYTKVGVNLNATFLYVNNAGPVTGVSPSAFTIQIEKNGVGSQATTGVVITEIDAVNNPGEYAVTCSGASSFLAATGSYDLVVFVTATVTARWLMSVRVTSDGTGAGSWGDASFTAVASNGRITIGGGTPLAGATVRILNGSVLYVQTVSDASGLWGPVYFNVNGTYTIQVQKSGYTLATGTITVSSMIATGPGADIALAASSTATSVTATSLWQYAKRMMKDAVGAKADQEAKEIVDDALSQIATSRKWPYLETVGAISVSAAYTTGTIALTQGSAVVTLTGGTFPTWAASGSIYGSNGQEMPVLTRDSGTQVTLKTAWAETSIVADAYSIAQHNYALPADLLIFETLTWGTQWPYGTDPVSAATLALSKNFWVAGTPRAYQYAIANGQIQLWPFPTEAHIGNVTYFRKPANLVSGSDTMDFDILLLELVRRAIDYQVSIRRDCVAGTRRECLTAYEEAWGRGAVNDKTTTGRNLGSTKSWDPSRPFRSPTIV